MVEVGVKAVIFDCDGVMFDTAQSNSMYYNKVLDHFDMPPLSQEQFVKVHMFTVKDALEYLFSGKRDLTEVVDVMSSLGYRQFIKYMTMEAGLPELLDALKQKELIRAVATNRTNSMDAVLLEHDLSGAFDMVVTSADVEKPKPHPDQLIMIKERFHLDPGEMIFIGDSEFDEQAALGAGVPFIAFKNSALKARYHVTSMAEIGRILSLNI